MMGDPSDHDEAPPIPDPVVGYFDDAGILRQWPSRRRRNDQLRVLEWFQQHFEPEVGYTEREVDAILKARHAFQDHALLRRELIEAKLLRRTPDGSRYWRPTG